MTCKHRVNPTLTRERNRNSRNEYTLDVCRCGATRRVDCGSDGRLSRSEWEELGPEDAWEWRRARGEEN